MSERYTKTEMDQIWVNENRYNTWTKAAILVVEAWAENGDITQKEARKIREKISVDIKYSLKNKKETNLDVPTFNHIVSKSLGSERRWIQ